jgi:uncharacterized protein YbjT (DUF2867 family)
MITVFGATGNTGRTAATRLLKAGKKVRAVARHREKLADLGKAGAEIAVGDVEDAGFVREALGGAEAAYVLIPPNMVVDDFRAYQKRVVDAVAGGVEAAGVKYVVLLSSLGAHQSEGTGPIVGLHLFEERLKKITALNALFLRAGFFMENTLMGVPTVKGQGIYATPFPGDIPAPYIAAADIGTYAALRLERLDFKDKSVVHLTGPKSISGNDVVSLLGQAIGKPIRYVQSTFEAMEQGLKQAGLKPAMIADYIEMYKGAGKGLLAAEAGGVMVATSTTFETFAKDVFLPAYGG